MLAGRGTELAVGAVGINAERDASNADVSRLSDADIRLAHTDHATSHDFAGAPLFARGTSYETNSGFLSVTNSQDTATWDTVNESIEPSEPPMPAALSFSRTKNLEGGSAKLFVAATALIAACVLVASRLFASGRMSIANQLYMKGEHAMPDVLHDKAAASTKEAKADRAAALDDLENLLQLLDNNNLAT